MPEPDAGISCMVRVLMLDHDKRGYRATRRGEPSKQGARPAASPGVLVVQEPQALLLER
jgi:hypothetical protein